MKTKKLFSLILLGLLCSVGNSWGSTTAPTGAAHKPGVISEGNLVSANGRKYEVFFSNNAAQTSFLVGSNTSATTETTGTSKWCNIGSGCGNNNNNISTAFTLGEFVSNVKSSNNKAIRVQSTASSEKNIVMVVQGYDSIAILAKSNDLSVYAEVYNEESYGASTALTLVKSISASSHYKRSFALDSKKQYRLTIAYGTSGSTNKDFVAFSLCIPAAAAKAYTVTAASNNEEYGTATAAASSLDKDETTTITASPNTGYEFVSWAVSGEGSTLSSTTANPTTLTMGTANATVTATFSAINYAITHSVATNGTYTIQVAEGSPVSTSTTANYGQTITLAAIPASGYELEAWNVTKTSGGSAVSMATANKFVMPAEAVTVAPTFRLLTCATPTISPADGSSFSGASQEITLACATDDATIYYTLDGSTPTDESTEYTGAFSISSTTTIKAIAVNGGYVNSDVASATITKIEMLTQQPVSVGRTWDWSKLSAVGELTDETTPSINDEFVMANMDGVRYTDFNLGFNSNFTQEMGREIVISKTQYVRRSGNGDTFQNGTIKMIFAQPGTLQVYFTGTSSSGQTDRYLVINGEQGSVATSGTNQKNETFNVVGDVTISFLNGKPLRIQKIVFTPIASVSKTITAAGWATYCSPYALDFSGDIEHLDAAYIVTGGAAGVLSMDEVTGTVPANTGLLLKGEGECVIPVVASSSTNVSANKLVGVTEETEIDANTGYVLMASPSLGFYKNANAFTLGANTAYLPVGFDESTPDAAPSAFRIVDEVNGATDIQNIEANEKAVKFIENGRILILRDGITYDALGRKVR